MIVKKNDYRNYLHLNKYINEDFSKMLNFLLL